MIQNNGKQLIALANGEVGTNSNNTLVNSKYIFTSFKMNVWCVRKKCFLILSFLIHTDVNKPFSSFCWLRKTNEYCLTKQDSQKSFVTNVALYAQLVEQTIDSVAHSLPLMISLVTNRLLWLWPLCQSYCWHVQIRWTLHLQILFCKKSWMDACHEYWLRPN